MPVTFDALGFSNSRSAPCDHFALSSSAWGLTEVQYVKNDNPNM